MQKTDPRGAIRHAHTALERLRAENAVLAEALKGILPGYARLLEKNNEPVTAETLLDAARKGPEWFKGQRPANKTKQATTLTPLQTYRKIVRAFPVSIQELFVQACEEGDLEQVQILHENGAVISAADPAPLIRTIEAGHLHVLKYLHKNGASIAAHNRQTLIAAITNGHLDIVEYLDENGAQVTAQNAPDLIGAATNGHLSIVKHMHKQGIVINAQSFIASKAVIGAAERGYLDVIEYLHENGANITAENNMAMVQAIRKGHLHIVKYLHKNGVKLTIQNTTDLINAAEEGHCDVVQYLHENGVPLAGGFIEAAFNGHLDVVKYMHKHGVDIKAKNNMALVRAAEEGRLDVVQYLHEQGCDITAQDNAALIRAASKGHLDVVRYLHKNGADITARDNMAVIRASENGHGAVVQYLHENGADISAEDNRAVIGAAENGHLDVVYYLHKNGADISAQKNRAITNAAASHHLTVVHYLHNNGARIENPIIAKKIDVEALTERLAYWHKIVRRDPPVGVQDQNPRYFKQSAFEFILPLLEAEGYKGEMANNIAFHAAGLFQTPARVMQYLEQWGKVGKQPLHDLLQTIKLPQEDCTFSIKDWGDAVLKCGPSMAKLVGFMNKVPSPERTRDGKSWSFTNTRNVCAQFSFKNAEEHPQLAELCFEHSLTEEIFNKALAVAKEPSKTKNIPQIVIEGERFGMPGHKFFRLPTDDVRGLVLGKITDCCQSIGSFGEQCAKHGYQSEDAAFFAIENAKEQITSQAFAWRSEDGGICLDTIETLGQNVSGDQWTRVLQAFADELTRRQDHDVTRLTVGMGGKTPTALKNAFVIAANPARPLNYDGYTEAWEQVTVWERPSGLRPS